MANDERRSEPAAPFRQKTPCPACGYLFDFGSHGARMCPRCMEAQCRDLQQAAELFYLRVGKATIH